MTYKPLPDSLTIKPSSINGLGLFATQDIKDGTQLGITHILINDEIIRTPLGGFINHSENPNCYINTEGEERRLYSVRPIKNGEEITVYYRFESYDGMTA